MDMSDLLKAKDPDLASSFIALKRAAKIARETAIQTNTGIVIMRDGKIVHISARELIAEKNQHDTGTASNYDDRGDD